MVGIMSTFEVGNRVRVKLNHWLRPHAFGEIVEYNPRRKRTQNHWLVRFDEVEEGLGFTVEEHNGQCLWLEENSIERVDDHG